MKEGKKNGVTKKKVSNTVVCPVIRKYSRLWMGKDDVPTKKI